MPPSENLRPQHVPPQSLSAIATAVPGVRPAVAANTQDDVRVTGVAQSTHMVLPGDLYVAVSGSRFHGARFAGEARSAGAVAILTDTDGVPAAREAELPVLLAADPRQLAGEVANFVYGEPSSGLIVIGITGTNGKTTTSYLVEAALRAGGHTTGLIGTVETRLDDITIPAVRTTPEAAQLHALLAVARENGVSAVVMEVSSHALTLGRVAGVRFTAGAFTNLSVEHLDFHGDLEAYFAAKAQLFDGRCAHEIVNVDDPYGRRLTRSGTITVSTSAQHTDAEIDNIPDWTVSEIRREGFSQFFYVHDPYGEQLPARVRLPGDFNVANAVLAVATTTAVGVSPVEALRGIATTSGVPGRMERVAPDAPVLAVVDYAHAPDGVAKALAALRPVTAGRLISVLGCGGDRDVGKRPLMGAAAAAGSDLFIATDDNPRSEDPAAIRSQMLSGVGVGFEGKAMELGDRQEAINRAVRESRPGDTIAVLGKGHEQGQQVSGVVHPFDDRRVLAAAVSEVYT